MDHPSSFQRGESMALTYTRTYNTCVDLTSLLQCQFLLFDAYVSRLEGLFPWRLPIKVLPKGYNCIYMVFAALFMNITHGQHDLHGQKYSVKYVQVHFACIVITYIGKRECDLLG